MHQPLQGRDAIREFWLNYLSVFEQIHSQFTHTSACNGTITLEWISEGTLSSGEPFSYRGVSILETRDGHDSAVFLPQGAK